MRCGIISDIHASLDALKACLARLEGVDRIVCPGDIVGYGPDPEECLSLVDSIGAAVVIGNHDAAVCGLMDTGWFNPDAREAALWTRAALGETAIKRLAMLPATLTDDDFLMVHGSLARPMEFEYILSPSSARPCFEGMADHTLCLIGHSHISEAFVQRLGERGVDELLFTDGGKLDLRPGFRYIVNCGSVGQPRDGNPDAACAIYDSEAGTVEFIRVPYEIAAVQARMRAARLPEYLIVRLEYGA